MVSIDALLKNDKKFCEQRGPGLAAQERLHIVKRMETALHIGTWAIPVGNLKITGRQIQSLTMTSIPER
jgi:hypothetical protein